MFMSRTAQDTTPLMKQYFEIKSKYKDTILLYRMGDFYETFEEDARIAHKILGLTLTKRANGKAAEVALAGFPHHALDSYLPKLIRAGYRVAVCEQVEDPKTAKGIVRREVTEIVTPGTTLSDKILDQKINNYLACIVSEEKHSSVLYGLALMDVSTGEFSAADFDEPALLAYLQSVRPPEIIIPYSAYEAIRRLFSGTEWQPTLTRQEDWLFQADYAYDVLQSHFKTHSLKGYGFDEATPGLIAAGAALHYLRETQKSSPAYIHQLRRISTTDGMLLDTATLRNLDILDDGRSVGEGTLIRILDRTETAMGGRWLRKWLMRPLVQAKAICARLDAVEELVQRSDRRLHLQKLLKSIGDLERLMSRLCTNRGTPRELIALAQSVAVLPEIRRELDDVRSSRIKELSRELPDLEALTSLIRQTLEDDPPAVIRDGHVIRRGYHEELDRLRHIAYDGRNYLTALQQKERERTGIPSLKIQYNQVFGYYIEITHAHKDKIPSDYIRKQTLVNSERFITPELKEYEEKILNAEEKILQLEQELFDALRLQVSAFSAEVQKAAALIAELDCLLSFAECAVQYRYTRPEINERGEIHILQGRHPVVERLLPPDQPFIPNDTRLNDQEQILIITGPNMAGKSCYLKQTGLIVLMAQAGCFVPADQADIGIVDRIFTRVGASDNLASGESTFLVEMNETANILHHATSNSLILLDEIGRGTSTFDGLSIAWAIVEYLHHHPTRRPKTLFATHYHEMTDIAELLPRVKNYHMKVNKYQDKIIFVRKVMPGSCDRSYGIEVAKLAGLPAEVIARAKQVMANLESHELSAHKDRDALIENLRPPAPAMQLTLFGDPKLEKIKHLIQNLDINQMTPLEAMNKLHEIKHLMDKE